jgi:hypothetical protein
MLTRVAGRGVRKRKSAVQQLRYDNTIPQEFHLLLSNECCSEFHARLGELPCIVAAALFSD